jgi:hypothetical protein
MEKPQTWKPLSEVLGRVAAKLTAQRDKKGGRGTTLDATASFPGKGGTRHPKGRTGDTNKGGTVQPNLLHGANWRLRRANAASEGK